MGAIFAITALFCTLLRLTAATDGNITSTGSTVNLNGIPYYIPGSPFASVANLQSQILKGKKSVFGGLVPITIVGTSSVTFNLVDLHQSVKSYGEKDDVWNEGFLPVIFIQFNGVPELGLNYVFPKSTIAPDFAVESVLSTLHSKDSPTVPPGPYFISADGSLYRPYRLYGDISGAFTQPLIPAGVTYDALPATVPGIASPGVAVPSRLYFTRTAEKPLAGVRTGIKDIFDIAGLRTSNGNRAFYDFYPPSTQTAIVVQRLIDAGAVIVGKMKTSQFANGEQATADWVDYHSPFSPRGDGYQDPSSSSSGAGAGVGSYPWLDLALGSDTGGSIRGPSQVSGVYGNRPTHGLVSLAGAMPLAQQLDTAGFLTRDPTIWAAAAKVLYRETLFTYKSYPKKLRTISFPVSGSPSADPVKRQSDAIILQFLSKLEGFLKVKAEPLNYTALWDQTKPDPNLPSLSVLLNRTYPTIISKEQTKNVRDPFYRDYAAAKGGRRPFVDPVPLIRWAFGDSLPASELDVAVANKTLFQNFWEDKIVKNDSVTCSDTLFIYTSNVNIFYRNQYRPTPVPPFGFGDDQISIFAEIPDVVLPLGEASYNSTITLHPEKLPVSVDLMAARGCDGLIFNLVEDLYAAGILNKPLPGGTLEGGEILLKRVY